MILLNSLLDLSRNIILVISGVIKDNILINSMKVMSCPQEVFLKIKGEEIKWGGREIQLKRKIWSRGRKK